MCSSVFLSSPCPVRLGTLVVMACFRSAFNRSSPPHTFSKLRLINALMTRNLWPSVRDWFDTSGYYDIFVAAQDFREDHPQFAAALTAAKSRFGLADETAAILAESVS